MIYSKGIRTLSPELVNPNGFAIIGSAKDGVWKSDLGEIRSLFPARIYSQKQIFELAGKPRALLKIIDEAPEVEFSAFDARYKELVNRYKQIEQKILELNEED